MSASQLSPRPRRFDKVILEAAAKAIAPRVVEWFRDDPVSLDEIVTDLIRAAIYDHDGYAIASKLERQSSWSPDSELVDILDGFDHCVYTAHEAALREWTLTHEIVADYPVGSTVEIARHGKGTIYDIRHDTAQYIVNTTGDPNHRGGFVIAFEDAKSVEPEAA